MNAKREAVVVVTSHKVPGGESDQGDLYHKATHLQWKGSYGILCGERHWGGTQETSESNSCRRCRQVAQSLS